MEPDAGRPGQNPKPVSPTPPRPALARNPPGPRPGGVRVRSYPDGMRPVEGGKPKILPMDAPEPKKRFNRLGIILALVVCAVTIPFTYQFQKSRVLGSGKPRTKTNYETPPEQRQWRMRGVVDNTEKQVIDRFGTPYLSRNYNMSDGAFVGPLVGQKRFYAKTLPDYEARTADKEEVAVWTYPQYLVIREVIWQLPDSYLTVWMREPRAEIDLSDDKGLTTLPVAPESGGDWVVIDNFRIGKDLFKNPPTAANSSPAADKTP